jgi:hypothetical protein
LIFIFLFWWQVFSSWKIRFFRFPLPPPPHNPQNPKKKKKKKKKIKKKKKKKKKPGGGGGGGGVQEKVLKRKHFLPILFISGCPGEGEKKRVEGSKNKILKSK